MRTLTLTWILCNTRRWRQSHVRSRQQTCVSFFMPHNSFNKPFEFNLLYKTNTLHFSVCLYCKVYFPCSHRKNWFAAPCECLHLIKQNSQCLFACWEFFLIRYKYSQRAANQFLRWLKKRLNRSQKTELACKEQHCTPLDLVSCRTFLFSLHAVTLSMTYHSIHARKNLIYLLNTITQSLSTDESL